MELISLFAVLFNISLGTFVLLCDPKSRNNQLFFSLVFIAAIWSLSHFLLNAYPSLFWFQSTYAIGSIMIAVGLIWILTITSARLKSVMIYFYFCFAVILFFCSFQNGFISKDYSLIATKVFYISNIGWGLIPYFIFYFTSFIIIIYRLHVFQRNSKAKDIKHQYRLMLYGLLFAFTVTAFSSFILPLFSIFISGWVDNIGFLFFLIMVTYSMSKYNFFNTRILSTQIIISILWIFMLIRVIYASSLKVFFIESGLFVIALAVGILLIRSVLQGIKQRKEIEGLTSNLTRAYEHIQRIS